MFVDNWCLVRCLLRAKSYINEEKYRASAKILVLERLFLSQATLTQLNYTCELLLIQVIGENLKELNCSG